MDTLPLTDGKTTKIHIAELSEKLKEKISLTDVAYRFQAEDVFLGTSVQGTSAYRWKLFVLCNNWVIL